MERMDALNEVREQDFKCMLSCSVVSLLSVTGFLRAGRHLRGRVLLSVLTLLVLLLCPSSGLPAGEVCVHLLRPGDSGPIPAQGQTDIL